MKSLQKFIQAIIFIMASQQSFAQIGYQVSLLNSATGEPRAGETVEVKITLTNCEGTIIHDESQKVTTNDFGILSLAIGNENTFEKVDWNKLPFFISASVDGKLIGKSQVLTVPVAEYAKKTGILTKEILCSKSWSGILYESEDWYHVYKCIFSDNGFTLYKTEYGWNKEQSKKEWKGSYIIDGNDVIFTFVEYNDTHGFLMKYSKGTLYSFDGFKSVVVR